MKYLLILSVLFLFSCETKPIKIGKYLGKITSIERIPSTFTRPTKTVIELDSGLNFMIRAHPPLINEDSVFLTEKRNVYYFKQSNYIIRPIY